MESARIALLAPLLATAFLAGPPPVAAAGDYLFTTLHIFRPGDSLTNPGNLTVDAAGNLYGTASNQGFSDQGGIFKIAAGGHDFSTVINFPNPEVNIPFAPNSLAVDPDGNLRGTGFFFDISPPGFTYKVDPATGSFAYSYSPMGFPAYGPSGLLTEGPPGQFFFTVSSFSHGAALAQATPQDFVYLASFDYFSTTQATSLVADSRGNVFGTTTGGSLFEVAAGSQTITTLSPSFLGPLALFAGGQLYGQSPADAQGRISLFSLTPGEATPTILAAFSGADDPQAPLGGSLNHALVIDGSGNLFGTTAHSVFELPAGSHSVLTLAGGPDFSPLPGLAVDARGNVYGTTGTSVFELSPVPEPSSLALLALGGLGLGLAAMRRRRRA